MREPAPLPFLARPGYRRRRLIEAIKIVPFAGIMLFGFPLLWPEHDVVEQKTSSAVIYLFSCWLVLIVAAFLGARALRRADRMDGEEGETR